MARIALPDTAFSLDPANKNTKSFKDPGHLAFIRTLPSVISGELGCDAAHLRAGSAFHNKKKTGGGQRSSDCWALPLTRDQHRAQHDFGNELGWWRLMGIDDPFDVAAKLYDLTGRYEEAVQYLVGVRQRVRQ